MIKDDSDLIPCSYCDDSRHVCEYHNTLPWEGASDSARSCKCGGAGMSCPKCGGFLSIEAQAGTIKDND